MVAMKIGFGEIRMMDAPLQRDMAFLDSLHVEANGRDGAGFCISITALFNLGSKSRLSPCRSHILDGKLAALYHSVSLKRPDEHAVSNELTARTRSSDVLPAFWRPIMVMSISVALHCSARQLRHRRRPLLFGS